MLWLDDPIAAALALPPLALPLLVFGSALLEYVFPPWWGDSLVLMGFFLAAQGAASPPLLFAAAIAGSALGAAAAYGLGRRYGLALVRLAFRRRSRSRSRRRTRDLFRRFGEPVLLVNRFLPVVRGGMLYGAGALGLRFWRSFVYANVSNLAFLTLLMWIGFLTAGSWEETLAAARHYNRLLGLAILAAAGAWILAALVRLRPPRPSVGG